MRCVQCGWGQEDNHDGRPCIACGAAIPDPEPVAMEFFKPELEILQGVECETETKTHTTEQEQADCCGQPCREDVKECGPNRVGSGDDDVKQQSDSNGGRQTVEQVEAFNDFISLEGNQSGDESGNGKNETDIGRVEETRTKINDPGRDARTSNKPSKKASSKRGQRSI